MTQCAGVDVSKHSLDWTIVEATSWNIHETAVLVANEAALFAQDSTTPPNRYTVQRPAAICC